MRNEGVISTKQRRSTQLTSYSKAGIARIAKLYCLPENIVVDMIIDSYYEIFYMNCDQYYKLMENLAYGKKNNGKNGKSAKLNRVDYEILETNISKLYKLCDVWESSIKDRKINVSFGKMLALMIKLAVKDIEKDFNESNIENSEYEEIDSQYKEFKEIDPKKTDNRKSKENTKSHRIEIQVSPYIYEKYKQQSELTQISIQHRLRLVVANYILTRFQDDI